VKRYADEAGSDSVRDLGTVVVSALARVEVPSALWRKQREGALEADAAAVLTALFEADYLGDEDRPPELIALAVTGAVLEEAARLSAVHALRALDAVQLASALAARTADPDCTTFVCFDRRLREAAVLTGFRVQPAGRP